jgi:hypothetical protein
MFYFMTQLLETNSTILKLGLVVLKSGPLPKGQFILVSRFFFNLLNSVRLCLADMVFHLKAKYYV